MLPKLPSMVSVQTMADDLGVSYKRVWEIIQGMRSAGYRIQSTAGENGLRVGVSVLSWDKVVAMAERYWEQQYEERERHEWVVPP